MTPTESEIEAVARAIFEAQCFCTGEADNPFEPLKWEDACTDEYPVEAANCRTLATAAIAALDKARGWQPIETAPRDGTRVRLAHERDASSMKVESIFKTTGRWNGSAWEVSAYFIVPGGQNGLMASEPTHWRPLPAPPATEGGEG